MTRTGTPSPKQRLYAQLARIARSMASPERLELVEILAQGERSVAALAEVVRLPIANVSHHLQVLRDTGLVIGRKQGLFVRYRLADPGVFGLHRKLATVGRRRLAEIDSIVQRYFEGRDELEPVGRAELLQRVREGSVLVLDGRLGAAVARRAGPRGLDPGQIEPVELVEPHQIATRQ